jgi:ribonuclease D
MRYIDTRSELVEFCDTARTAGPVAIDMEFERERTYYAKLQLVQLATPTEQAIVDPLAIEDFGPIGDLLTDPDVPILLHAGG